MAEGVNEQTECGMAIVYVSTKILMKFPQYPQFANKFKLQCIEEAFEEIDVLIEDFAEGFDESVILESIVQDIDITDDDKEPLCKTIHNLLSTFIPSPPEPVSLNLVELNMQSPSDNDINSMRMLVLSQTKLLQPNNKDDTSIFKVLVIGQQNHLPLLIYLVDMYHRYRLYQFFKHSMKRDKLKDQYKSKLIYIDIKIKDFFKECHSLKELAKKSKNNSIFEKILLWYQNAMKSAAHRNGLFYSLPLNKSQINSKINDSLQIFTLYSISILKSVNNMIKELSINFPVQIDIWIIPEQIKDISFDEDIDDNDDDKSNEIEELTLKEGGLSHTNNLRTVDIVDSDINQLSDLFGDAITNVINRQTHKRMVMVIDRTRRVRNDNNNDDDDEKQNDLLHAYLPKNTQNIPKGNYLYETMINLTKTEILPSKTGDINQNTINSNSDIANMFVLSLHIHRENKIAMYWHYGGSCTRFVVNDMMTLWPLYFIINKSDDYNDKLIEKYVTNNRLFDRLIDPNFKRFYEINTQKKWEHTIQNKRNSYRAKPEKMKSEIDKEAEFAAELKLKHIMKKLYANPSTPKKNVILTEKRNSKRSSRKTNNFNVGDVKMDDHIISNDDTDILITTPMDETKVFLYQSDFDENGLLYFLGSDGNRKKWAIPATKCMVSISASSLASDSKSLKGFIGRECVRCFTDNAPPSWMAVNLQDIAIKLSHYTLRHYNSHNAALIHWTLEGSNDGKTWVILKNHINDKSLNNPGDTRTWTVCTNGYFSQFRIYMTDKNNTGRWYLACSGIELYGKAYGGLVSESLMDGFYDIKDDDEEDIDDEKDINDNDEKPKWSMRVSMRAKFKINNNDKDKDKENDDEKKKEDVEDDKLDKNVSPKTWMRLSKLVSMNNKSNWKWNVYPKEYKKCIQNKGMIIRRLPNEFNEIIGNTMYFTQFMFGCSNYGINKGLNEFKIKYESVGNEYCVDAVGIISNINSCKEKDRWITNTMDDNKVFGTRYVYWGGGKIYCIDYYNDWRNIKVTPYKWRKGEILTVRVDCNGNEWFITFYIDDKKINDDIQIKNDGSKYYPIISTQSDDTRFTIIQ